MQGITSNEIQILSYRQKLFIDGMYIRSPRGDRDIYIIMKINLRYSNNSGIRFDFEFGSQIGADLKVKTYRIVGPVNGVNTMTLINILNGC